MPFQPANSRSMPATHAVLDRLYGLWGHWTLSGQANPLSWPERETDRIAEITGDAPSVWATDFGWSGDKDDENYLGDRDGLLDAAERQHRAGSLIQLDWFPANPVVGEPCGFTPGLVDPIADRDFEAMLTPGTSVHTRWLTQLAVVGVFLRHLKEMGVVVLFRPCPDMNGSRWWWRDRPGPAGYVGLWRSIFDHFIQNLHLDNLLWVWAAEAWVTGAAAPVDPAPFYPGHGMVDVLGCDVWGFEGTTGDGLAAFPRGRWDGLLRLGGGRALALGRTGLVPDQSVLSGQRWLWFTRDGQLGMDSQRDDEVRMRYAGDYLLHRDGLNQTRTP